MSGAIRQVHISTVEDTRLFEAITARDDVTVKKAISAGANVDAIEGIGRTSMLHYAVNSGNIASVRHLLNAGADVNALTTRDITPLCFAVRSKSVEMAELLLDYGANPDIYDQSGMGGPNQTALHVAVGSQITALIQPLLRAGADPSLKDRLGNTPHKAAQSHLSNKPDYLPLFAHEKYPRLPDGNTPITRAELFERHELSSMSMMENPVTWRRWDELTERLAASGEPPLTKQELSRRGPDGKTGLDRALDARVLDKVVVSLNAQGESVDWQDFGQRRPDARDLTQSAHLARAIITKSNTYRWGIDRFSENTQKFEPLVRDAIPDYTVQRLNAERLSRPRSQGR